MLQYSFLNSARAFTANAMPIPKQRIEKEVFRKVFIGLCDYGRPLPSSVSPHLILDFGDEIIDLAFAVDFRF